jgi:hypothetical protein
VILSNNRHIYSAVDLYVRRSRIDEAALSASQVRLDCARAEVYAVGVAEGDSSRNGNIAGDHCAHIGHDFDQKWSMTFTNEDKRIMSFEIVGNTSIEFMCARLEEIRERPSVKGRRYVLTVDNMPHNLDAPSVRRLLQASGAEALLQDRFHVVQRIKSILNNTHEAFIDGTVLRLF